MMLPLTASEAGAGLVPPAVAVELLGNTGAALILIMLFMAIVSTGSAESIAVSSLVAYDIYREYINPEATGEQILYVSRVVIVVFGAFMGGFAVVLYELGLVRNIYAHLRFVPQPNGSHPRLFFSFFQNLGWVYLFMGILIGSAVFPLWNMMTWTKASGTGAIIAAWSGLALAIAGWMIAATIQSGSITIDNLGTNEAMLSGNLVAILSSGLIHYVYSTFIDPQDYDFATLDASIKLVEDDQRGLTEAEKDPELLANAERWITRRGYCLSVMLIIVWPLLSLPAGVFSKSYFAFWVLISMIWGFGAAIIITVLPLTESADDINLVLFGAIDAMFGREPALPEATAGKADDDVTPDKEVGEEEE